MVFWEVETEVLMSSYVVDVTVYIPIWIIKLQINMKKKMLNLKKPLNGVYQFA